RAAAPGESREFFFELVMRAAVPGHEMRGAAASAIGIEAALEGCHDVGMAGEAEIVIAAEREQLATRADDDGLLRRILHAAQAIQLLAFARVEPCPEFVGECGHAALSLSPRRKTPARLP